jgi:hypothetical protein
VSLLPRVIVKPMLKVLSHAGRLVSANWLVAAGTNTRDAKSALTLLCHQNLLESITRLVLIWAGAMMVPATKIKIEKYVFTEK